MLPYFYVNLRLLIKLTSEMGDIFTDAMRDSNSHEFEEIVDPISCMPNEELEDSLDAIDETLYGERIYCHHCILMVECVITESWWCYQALKD